MEAPNPTPPPIHWYVMVLRPMSDCLHVTSFDFDAFVDDDPFGLNSLATHDTSTPTVEYSGTVGDLLGLGGCADTVVSAPTVAIEVASAVDNDLFDFVPHVKSGLTLTASPTRDRNPLLATAPLSACGYMAIQSLVISQTRKFMSLTMSLACGMGMR